MSLRFFHIVFLGCLLSWQFANAQPMELPHVRAVLESNGKGYVNKWTYTPRIAVIHDEDLDLEPLRQVLLWINRQTGLDIETDSIKTIDLRGFPKGYRARTQLRYRRVSSTGRPFMQMLYRAAADDGGGFDVDLFRAEFIVFQIGHEAAGYYAQLLYPQHDVFRNSIRTRTGACRVQSISGPKGIALSYVQIPAGMQSNARAQCIYEEVVHAMGVAHDSRLKLFFTFDKSIGVKENNYDWRLLRTLYSPDISPQDSLDRAIEVYERVAQEEGYSCNPFVPGWQDMDCK